MIHFTEELSSKSLKGKKKITICLKIPQKQWNLPGCWISTSKSPELNISWFIITVYHHKLRQLQGYYIPWPLNVFVHMFNFSRTMPCWICHFYLLFKISSFHLWDWIGFKMFGKLSGKKRCIYKVVIIVIFIKITKTFAYTFLQPLATKCWAC